MPLLRNWRKKRVTKSNDKKVPALRFKGFTDDWEQRKFNKIANKIGATSSAKIPNVSYDDILSKRGVLNKKISKLSTGKKGIKFKENDILFGKLRPYLKNYLLADFSGIAIGDFWVLRPLESPDFLFYLIQSQKFTYISNISSGSKMPRSDWKLVSSFHFDIPKINEQIGIGKVLKLLDKLISLQQRKLRYLSAIKKSLLQNMLVDNDLRPELRFTKFSGNWEQHKISEMAKRLDNLRIPVTASNRKKGDIPYYGANGIQDYVEGFTHKGENILIAEDGANNLDNYPIRLVKGKIWVNNHAHVLKAYKNCTDIQFLEFELKKLNIYKYLVGGSRLKLNADILMNISIKSPTLKEQKKIGFMLSLLEENTIFQQRKLNKLELLNQFFLQHMFI